MMRFILSLAAVFALTLAPAVGDDNKKADDKKPAEKGEKDTKTGDKTKKGDRATITSVDEKNQTVTVKMKGKDGKATERTFKLTREARYFDSAGNVAAVNVFRSGDYVLVVEAEGQIQEMRQDKTGDATSQKGSDDKSKTGDKSNAGDKTKTGEKPKTGGK